MKKNYLNIKTFIALFILFAVRAGAQLSGVVTVDNMSPASATNFTTFTSLATVLNTSGVSGPLVVNVVATSTVYNEQVNFTQAPGISATNTITINGNGRTITFSATAAATPWTVLLTGADYMTFNNLNIIGQGASYALVCHLWSGANDNAFNDCVFTAPLNGSTTTQSPYSISGTSISAIASGISGNNNIAMTCTMSGGYYGVAFAGATAVPFNINNQVLNSKIVEFYYYGFYHVYCQGSVLKNNIIERPTKTTISTTNYIIYLSTGSIANTRVEGNHIRKLFDGVTGSTATAYMIYCSVDATAGNENIIRNNLISDIKSSGTQYGIYMTGAAFAKIEHNTVVFDDATSTAGTTYGIYTTGPNNKIRNNIVYISRAGTGTKYCLYTSTAATSLTCNYNVLNMLSTAGTSSLAFLGSAYSTLALWQNDTGYDLNSSTSDPMFTNPAGMNYVPTSTVINNMGLPVGTTTDITNATRSLIFPDPGAFEFFNTACNTAPSQLTLTALPTVSVCPGTVLEINLLGTNNLLNGGYTLQWQSSTNSNLGPFTPISGATVSTLFSPPVTVNTWYNAVVSCPLSGGTSTTASKGVLVAPTSTNTVPYYEGFESLVYNKLPNCSWSATNFGSSTLTYTNVLANNRVPRTGTNFAAFYSTPTGTNYFYTNGIYMTAGLTYSAAVWYITETVGFTNWNNLSIMVGPNQSTTGLVTVASTGGTMTPLLYTLLSNTFTIPTTGMYYIAIKGVSGTGVAPYLSWDDLSVTLPCQYNGSNLTLSAATSTLCYGQSLDLIGSGASSYSWSTGETTSSITATPLLSTTYTLTGTNTLSGCENRLTYFIDVLPSPQVVAFGNVPAICSGKTATITAYGADTYFWAHGVNVQATAVSPTITTTYSVIGTNSLGCTNLAVVVLTVNTSPNVTASSSQMLLCNGDQITLTGSGALNYQWMLSSSSVLLGNPIAVSPNASATYTVIGTDGKGCEGKTTLSFGVDECTGLTKLSAIDGLKLYPNPTSGQFVIESRGNLESIEIIDITGRVISSQVVQQERVNVSLSSFANGIYYVKIKGADASDIIKVVKSN